MTPTPLSSVCDIYMGQAPRGTSYNTNGAGYPLLAGAGDFGSYSPQPKKFTTAPTKISMVDDIILCIRATIGDLNWSDKEYCLGRGVAGLRPKEGLLSNAYLWRWLEYARKDLEKKATGSTFKQISQRNIAELEILLPNSLDEQRRIVAILDKADAIRRKREQALELADEFLKSLFFDMFGDLELNQKKWKTKPIADILCADPQNGLYKPSSDYGTGTPILRIDSFYDGYIMSGDAKKRLRIDNEIVERYRLHAGDIIINRVNSKEYLGKSALVEGLEEDTVFESNMMRFSVRKTEISPRFLVDQLGTSYVKRQIKRAAKDAVNQSSINQTDVKEIKVRLPPIKLQEKYADIVIKKTSNTLKQLNAWNEANDLFSSLSQRAFRGEL